MVRKFPAFYGIPSFVIMFARSYNIQHRGPIHQPVIHSVDLILPSRSPQDGLSPTDVYVAYSEPLSVSRAKFRRWRLSNGLSSSNMVLV
jgi:hypothetical protein